MAFEELDESRLGAHLDLPIRGTTYRIPDVDADTALWVEQLIGVGAALASDQEVGEPDVDLLDDGDERDLYERLLGDAYERMRADGLGWSVIKHAGMTVMAWVLQDRDAAETYWASGGGGGALGEVLTGRQGNRASRRASEAAARKTRSQGSTSGSSPSPQRRGGRKGPAAGRSRGNSSSTSGR